MLATHPRPLTERSSIAVNAASSHSRPTNVETRGLMWGRRPVTDTRVRAETGRSAPLIRTSCGSPRTAAFSTSSAVDPLSITPPGGATDSIRCAIPTWSPIVV